jgi:hypothetical protein
MNQIATEFKKQSRHQDKQLLQTLSDALDILSRTSASDWTPAGTGTSSAPEATSSLTLRFGMSPWRPPANAAGTTPRTILGFVAVSQDGDEEGILKLERMPTALEAKTIRAVILV